MNIDKLDVWNKTILPEKIHYDAVYHKQKLTKITNERDLESVIYYHLRKKIHGDYSLKISTNFTFNGIDSKEIGKKRKKNKTTFIQPDVVVLRWKKKEHNPFIDADKRTRKTRGFLKPLMAFELKHMQPGEVVWRTKEDYRELFKNRSLQKDFKKLNMLLENEYVDNAYFIYLYHDEKITEKNLKTIIKSQVEKKHSKLEIITINKFKITKEEKEKEKNRKKWNKIRQFGRFYTKSDTRKLWKVCDICGKFVNEHTDIQEEKCQKVEKQNKKARKAKTNGKSTGRKAGRSAAAKKAARTKEKKYHNASAKEKRKIDKKRSAAAKKAARTKRRKKRSN